MLLNESEDFLGLFLLIVKPDGGLCDCSDAGVVSHNEEQMTVSRNLGSPGKEKSPHEISGWGEWKR